MTARQRLVLSVGRSVLASIAFAAIGAAQAPGFDPERLQRVDALVREAVMNGDYAGASYCIVHRDVVAAEGVCGVRDVATGAPMQKDSIVRIYSMSKMVTAVAVLQLYEAGRLSLTDDVAKWLPEFGKVAVFVGGTAESPQLAPAARRITLRMLLNHTAGLTYDFVHESPVQELYRRQDLWAASSMSEFVQKAATLPLLSQPGEAFHYSIADDVLGAVVERCAGVPFAQYVKERITAPLGMVDTDFDVPEAQRARLATLATTVDGKLQPAEVILGAHAEPGRGIASGGAGMFSTIGDYVRFLRAIAACGQLDGTRILGRKTLELAMQDSLQPEQGRVAPGTGWGLLCAVRTDPGAAGEPGSKGMLYWSGAATTHFVIDPQEQLIAVLFCQHVPYDQHRLLPRFRTAVLAALR